MAAVPAPPALPVLRLVRHAYLDLVANWRALVQAGGFWLVLPWVMHALDNPGLELLGDLALTAGFAAVAVAWHRRLLLGEPMPARIAPLTGDVARYLGYWAVIVVLAAGPSLLTALLIARAAGVGGGDPGEAGAAAAVAAGGPGLLAAVLVLLVGLAGLLAAVRLQLVFPAAAIGERAVTFKASWAATRGNGWRLLAGVLLVSAPPALAGTFLALVLAALAEATGSLVLRWLGVLAPIAGAWLQAPLLAAFLSFAYLFARQGGPGAPLPAERPEA